MKIRNGFVSNSSSSSFVIEGSLVTSEDFRKLKNYDNIIVLTHKDISEGEDYILQETELFDFLKFCHYKKFINLDNYDIFYAEKLLYDEYERPNSFAFEGDYHHTCDIDLFIDRYIDGDEQVRDHYEKWKRNFVINNKLNRVLE
jgi:hypothetical protein